MTDKSKTIAIPSVDTQTLETALRSGQPILLWLADGQTMATDMRKALEALITSHQGKIEVLAVNTSREPSIGEKFGVGKHPVLVAWYANEIVLRRNRPWATDVASMADALVQRLPKPSQPTNVEKTIDSPTKEKQPVSTPVKVTDATFQQEVLESDVPVLVDFWAEWCGPCKMIAPTLEKLAAEYSGKVKIAKVNVDENQGLSGAFKIMSIPTLMFVKGGKIVGQSAGAAPEPALRDVIEQLIALELPA